MLETNFQIPPQLDFETMVNEIEKKWKVEFINSDKCIIKFQKGITFRDWGFGAFLEVRSNTAYLVTFPLSGNSMGQNKRAKAFNYSVQNLISNVKL